jgi:hypothetical protein
MTGERRRANAGLQIVPGQETRSEFWAHAAVWQRIIVDPPGIGSMWQRRGPIRSLPHILRKADARAVSAASAAWRATPAQPRAERIDFVEMLQYGWIKTKAWYQLTAGLWVVGTAGCDFRIHNHFRPTATCRCWVGRTLVKAEPGGYSFVVQRYPPRRRSNQQRPSRVRGQWRDIRKIFPWKART